MNIKSGILFKMGEIEPRGCPLIHRPIRKLNPKNNSLAIEISIEILKADEILLYLETEYFNGKSSHAGFTHWFLDSKGRKIYFSSMEPISKNIRVKHNTILKAITK